MNRTVMVQTRTPLLKKRSTYKAKYCLKQKYSTKNGLLTTVGLQKWTYTTINKIQQNITKYIEIKIDIFC